ncbi:hypothetical protein MKW92_050769 [Papaver armeniacum]|nr:hypothetical protein MKW92_050769 [Papaver armeniacum]
MAKKNQVRPAKKDADDQESHAPLQAILLANTTFEENNFQPITKERPKVLLPLVNTPMIDYSLAWLKSAGVEQVFVVVCDNGAHSKQITDYMAKSEWSSLHNPKFSVKTIAPHGCVSAGDALRFIYELDVIRGDFILVRLLLDNPAAIQVHNDIEDCYVDVCSPEVLSLFADNFDYQQLRRDFVKGLLEDDVMSYKIFIHEMQSDYAARVDNFRSYDTISKDIMQRPIKLESQGIYKGSKRDGETSGSDSEEAEEDFDTEVEATFLRLVHGGVDQENTIIEVTSLRLAFNMESADCARALFWSMMKFAYETPYGTEDELYRNAVRVITTWRDLLRHYVTSTDEQIEIIATLEEMCSEFAKDFAAMFHKILHVLYEKDIVTEEAILLWESEKEGADASDKIFVNQSQSLIQWLKEAEEEED